MFTFALVFSFWPRTCWMCEKPVIRVVTCWELSVLSRSTKQWTTNIVCSWPWASHSYLYVLWGGRGKENILKIWFIKLTQQYHIQLFSFKSDGKVITWLMNTEVCRKGWTSPISLLSVSIYFAIHCTFLLLDSNQDWPIEKIITKITFFKCIQTNILHVQCIWISCAF